ncbi:MAG: cadherin-like beta sandwich domain-containing protein [Fibrobacteres bacterium]|nr:cadherin-like beta sandwich domain-containing protein [Fibrobacterota bacterium]
MNSHKSALRFRAFALAALASIAGLLIFWSCQLNQADGETKFNLTPDSAWTHCDTLQVELLDTSGKVLDTLFEGPLKSLDELNGLDASKYKGGRAQVHVRGWFKDGSLCADQNRTFDDQGGKVVVDTLSEPGAVPNSLSLSPESLSLQAGDPAVKVTAAILPKFAEQSFIWSVDDPSVATLDLPNGPNSSEALVIPLKNGTAHVRARAKHDSTKTAVIVVQIGSTGGRSISLQPDSLSLYLGGPDSVLKASTAPDAKDGEIAWSSSDEAVVKVDDQGRVHGLKEGVATVMAKFGDASALARIRVKRDVPVLTVSNKSGAAVNSPIDFSPKATQEFGSIVMFKWDLDGDSTWDDSLPGPFLGNVADLPTQTTTFTKEGSHQVHFLVRDSEGNEAVATVTVDIGNQPPETVSKSKDTLVSINDFVALEAKVRDAEGKVALVGWDYDGDGKLDDSIKANDSTASIKGGHKYSAPGKYVATLYATDDAGKTGTDSVLITVVLDPPTADMGPDISVIAGSPVNFSVKGSDKFGAIAKREIKVGSASFLNLGKQDTSMVVPGDTGKVVVIGRVTDDDGNSAEDTMVVTLLPPSKSNNDLSSLIPSAGTLTPSFKPVTVAYSMAVAYTDSLVGVVATTTDPAASLLINGKPVASGKSSDSVALAVGTTLKAFEIVVTAQDGTQKSYSIAVTRAPSTDASLAKLDPAGFVLKPSFKSDIFDYADTVAFKVASVTVKPTASHPAAKLTVNDTALTSGTVSSPLALDVGDNLFKIVVTAQDGKAKSTYTVKVVRRAKVIVSRAIGAVTIVVDSLEAPLGAVVNLKAPDSTGFHFAKWALTEGSGTFGTGSSDSTANPAKLTVKAATVRATGSFAINVYTITGTISGFVGGAFDHASIQIQHGKDTSITLTPLVGYRILSVTDSGAALASLGTATKFGPKTYKLTNVTKSHTLVATFLKTYTLTTSVTGTGTISPVGTTEVDSGSTQAITMVSGSPSTGVWVSAFTDNGTDVVASLTGDRMNTSTYSLSGIAANHTVAAAFDVRSFTLKIYGHDLCVNQVTTCTDPRLCILHFCLVGSGPDSVVTPASFGTKWNITTDSTNASGTKFTQWNKDGVLFNVNRGTTTDPVTADVNYTAAYPCCKLCCIIIGPPITTDPITTSPVSATTIPVEKAQSQPQPTTP